MTVNSLESRVKRISLTIQFSYLSEELVSLLTVESTVSVEVSVVEDKLSRSPRIGVARQVKIPVVENCVLPCLRVGLLEPVLFQDILVFGRHAQAIVEVVET